MQDINLRLNHFVNLDNYPIHEPESSAYESLIAEGHEMMGSHSICLLEGFLRPKAVEELNSEITALEQNAYNVEYLSTAYGWMNNSGFPDEHPRSQLFLRKCGVITTDQVPLHGACFELYKFDALTEFVRRLLKFKTLYRVDCPTLAIQINVMDKDDNFGWHFDTNDGVVSFSIQNAENGGYFEYAPLIRSEEKENYSNVAQIMAGNEQPVRLDSPPGTFSLFLGRRSLHRVSEVDTTTKKRQSLLFSYDREPGMVFPEKTQQRLTSKSSEPYLGQLTPT